MLVLNAAHPIQCRVEDKGVNGTSGYFTMASSLLNLPTSAITIKNLLRQYAKRAFKDAK